MSNASHDINDLGVLKITIKNRGEVIRIPELNITIASLKSNKTGLSSLMLFVPKHLDIERKDGKWTEDGRHLLGFIDEVQYEIPVED